MSLCLASTAEEEEGNRGAGGRASHLPVVTHAHFAHPPTVGIGKRDFLFAALCQRRQRLLVTLLARTQGRDLALHGAALGRGGALRRRRRLRAVARLERGQELRQPRIDALDPRAQLFGAADLRHVVDGLELRPVDGHQFAAEEFQIAAEQVKLPEDRLESLGVVPAEIGDGLEVGLQPVRLRSGQALRISQSTSRLRPPSSSSRRLERTLLR